jgi:hypothetical protein
MPATHRSATICLCRAHTNGAAVTVKNRSLSSPAELFIDDARKLAAGFSKQA